MSETCPSCKEEFEMISSHWARSSCEHPKFSDKQHEIIKGCLMGDGYLRKRSESHNSTLVLQMTSKKFLQHISDIFGSKCSSVRLQRTAEESYQDAIDGGLIENANEENYSNKYWCRLCSNPNLNKYYQWYKSEGKRFPRDLKLTKTSLKYWYVCDGTLNTSQYKFNASIAMKNEQGNREKIESYFDDISAPNPSFWVSNDSVFGAYWDKESTKDLLDFMGEPLPGFDYKWGI